MQPATCSNTAFVAHVAGVASELDIIVAEDIFDAAGAKVLAGEHRLTPELLERLSRHHLRKPIETSLICRNGLSARDLEHCAVDMCQNSAFLASVVGHEFRALRELFRTARIANFVQLVLSVQYETNPRFFAHSLQCALLAAALALRDETQIVAAEDALLAGLLHDFGELYMRTDLARNVAGSERLQWQQIAAHPEIGRYVALEFANCPASVAQAVYEHHERMDGSGYPRGAVGDALSPLGRLLEVVDTTCGILKGHHNRGAHVKLAVSFVSGEFDSHWVHLLVDAIRGSVASEIALSPSFDIEKAIYRARLMSQCLNAARDDIDRIADGITLGARASDMMALAQHRIARLKGAWEATGIGVLIASDISHRTHFHADEEAFFDIAVVSRELIWRMRALARQMILTIERDELDPEGILEPILTALEVTY